MAPSGGAGVDWADTAEEAAFRSEVRAFIDERLPQLFKQRALEYDREHYPGTYGWYKDRTSDDSEERDAAIAWAEALAERGWAAPHWPAEYGGAGLTTMFQFIFKQEMATAQAPVIGGTGVTLLGPTLIVHGNEEQKSRYIPQILSGEARWVQGYSEPGAGSDLAALQTRAERDGDEYVINGQKIWTSSAHEATSIFLLARTDPEAPRHRGITFLLIDDITTPGISVRPLIDMAWNHHLNEVFFEDARTPVDHVMGEENRGWYVGMTLLDFERSGISAAAEQEADFAELIEGLREEPGSLLDRSAQIRARAADLAVEIAVGYNLALRVASMQAAGQVPSHEASMGKAYSTELGQRLYAFGVRAFGLHSNLWPGEPLAPLAGKHTHQYLRSVPLTLVGGTSEVQRNIIATRGLGLPRS